MQVKLLPFLQIVIGNCKLFIPFYINDDIITYQIDKAVMFLTVHPFLS